MDRKKIKTKEYRLEQGEKINNTSDLELINQHTINPLTNDDVYTFKVVLCDNEIDRVYDKMTDKFLNDFAEKSKGLTGLKDHDWESDNQLARLYDTEVVEESYKLNSLGETHKYVLGKAYTLRKYKDYIDKINAGLLKESSISFDSVEDRCSICGEITTKGDNNIAICPNGHIMGHMYDDKICYNIINKLTDSFEWSLVAVPCQRNSGIKNKSITSGGLNMMKKSMFVLQKFLNSKAYKEADEETKEGLNEVIEAKEDTELTEEDIKKLIEENAKLKEEISSLKDKVREVEGGRTRDKIEAIVSKEIDSLNPLTPTVKENIMRDIDLDNLKLEDGQIPGLADVFTGIKERYKGLIDLVQEENEGEHAEPDGDEAENNLETLKQKSLEVKHNSGITFGINNKKKSVQVAKNGRTFN